MRFLRSTRARIAIGIVALLLVGAGWQGASYLWRHGYAVGTVTGIVRKVSVHGPAYCKVLTGELVYQTSQPGQAMQLFNFSIDDARDSNPVVTDLHQAERSGATVTLHFRQDKRIWWRCNGAENFITAVER